jgi:aminoglycoside phosphotransferase (APT) family kinase protein
MTQQWNDPQLLEALSVWMRSHVGGFTGPMSLQPFEGGQSNPTVLLQSPQGRWVLRAKPGPKASLLPSAHAIEREYRVMQALAQTEVPVPQMLALCEDESVIGQAFYVMAHVTGRIFWDPTLPELPSADRGALYDEMNRVLAALHRVEPVTVGLGDFGKPGNYFERQIKRWSQQSQASLTEPMPEMGWLMNWLPEHIPESAQASQSPRIVHGDFRLDNLMFHPTEPRVLAVLDWELSTLGHPLADLSYHCMPWHIPSGVFRGMAGADVASLGLPTEAQHIARYCARVGNLDPAVLVADWPFYLAYNLFRLAAILQGIGKRIEQGTATSAQAEKAAAAARPMAQLAQHWAQQHQLH